MLVVALVGAFTAIFAATIGLVQNDIKRVLAYSTVSQLGYMFIGMGVGAYAEGIFHLMTHAFFKACLFLGSGSVIHSMSGEQDMFCFMIDPTGWIEIEGENFAPGFFVWNSEVGRRSLGIQTFWFQAICQMRQGPIQDHIHGVIQIGFFREGTPRRTP